MSFSYHLRLSEFAEEYDIFIFDLWGVLHDGQKAYSGAIEALRELRSRNKKIILLSNAPRRATKAIEVLEKLGFDKTLYDAILTSGEVTYNYMKTTINFGSKYYYIGPEKDISLLDGLPYEAVTNVNDANFAMVTGFEQDNSILSDIFPDLESCINAKLPLICVNPDKIVVRQDGSSMLCAGVIAKAYSRMGGEVSYFGKPHNDTYQQCFEMLEIYSISRMVAIGDSLHTDIAGANNMGIFSVLITAGIMASELGVSNENAGELPKYTILEDVCQKQGIFPNAVLPILKW